LRKQKAKSKKQKAKSKKQKAERRKKKEEIVSACHTKSVAIRRTLITRILRISTDKKNKFVSLWRISIKK